MTSITIHNAYKWVADPRYGRIGVLIDGQKVGKVDVGASATFQITADEPHAVRVRLWSWFQSPTLMVNLGEGQQRTFHASIRKDVPVFRRMALMMRRPSESLYLGGESQ